uniref:Dolichyl-diphosphooligosaccharide--protein glycosyltransferase subunit 2 n=1 Tax=Trichuris muris TaxID=70415 RepID=A0A5S6QUZ4_TRIMR
MLFLALLTSLLWATEGNMSLNGALTADHLVRMKMMFQKTLKQSKSLELTAYSAYGMHLLNEKLEADTAKRLCELVTTASKSEDVVTVYHAVLLAVAVPNCKPPKLEVSFLERFIADQGTLKEVCFAVEVASRLGLKLDSVKLRAQTEKFMKTNDSASDLAYAFFIATHLSGNVDSFLARVEDCVAQADEIEGNYLQYEEGPVVTARVVSSIYALGTHAGKAPSLKQNDLVKFCNFLLAYLDSNDPEILYFVLMALNAVDKNPYHIPLYLSMESGIVISEKNPDVRLRVVNILNRPMQGIEVTADQVVNVDGNAVIIKSQPFVMQSGQPADFALKLRDRLPEPGAYRVLVDASSATNEKVLPVKGKEFVVKVERAIEVTDISFGVVDRDQSVLNEAYEIKYANKVVPISADNHQRLLGHFVVRDKSSQKPVKVQQAFLQLVDHEAGTELTFTATGAKDEYKFDLDFGKLAQEFDHSSGTFVVKLMVGDSVSSNAILKTVATLSLTLPDVYRPPKSPLDIIDYAKKPEITHVFRKAEKRPPQLISDSGIIFHVSFAAIFGLYGLFWLRLNMFETLKYLSVIGTVAFLSGHRILRYMAERSKLKEE